MKEKTKIVYYCEYCKKHYLSKRYAEYHEEICFKNPANDRACWHCGHLDKTAGTALIGYFYNGSENTQVVDLFYCNKKKEYLYTPKNEVKENWFDLGGDSNNPMPKQCDVADLENENKKPVR